MKSIYFLAEVAYMTYVQARSDKSMNLVPNPWKLLKPYEQAVWMTVARNLADELAAVH